MNSIVDYYKLAFQKFADFDWRANREEFWYFILVNFIVSTILSSINRNLWWLYSLIVLIPSIAITVRRLHDINKSWRRALLWLVPVVGRIWIIILLAGESVNPSQPSASPINNTPTSNQQ